MGAGTDAGLRTLRHLIRISPPNRICHSEFVNITARKNLFPQEMKRLNRRRFYTLAYVEAYGFSIGEEISL
jgi:hypothetical protein